jgi:branched-chain amino acid transport system ATP-binding protein
MSALEVKDLCKSFGSLVVTNGIDLRVEPGERRGIVGPNGAGKTTFFNLISGWMRPDAGAVMLEGKAVTGLSPEALARHGIARSFQKNSQFADLSVRENIRLAVQAQDASRAKFWSPLRAERRVIARAERVAHEVGLEAQLDRRSIDLSYGQKRQLEVAIALAGTPRLLLLDEPAAGTSPAERVVLAGLVKGLPRDVTVLIIEHDMDLVFDICDRISVLVQGRVLVTGTPDEIRGHHEVRSAYLGGGHANG